MNTFVLPLSPMSQRPLRKDSARLDHWAPRKRPTAAQQSADIDTARLDHWAPSAAPAQENAQSPTPAAEGAAVAQTAKLAVGTAATLPADPWHAMSGAYRRLVAQIREQSDAKAQPAALRQTDPWHAMGRAYRRMIAAEQ